MVTLNLIWQKTKKVIYFPFLCLYVVFFAGPLLMPAIIFDFMFGFMDIFLGGNYKPMSASLFQPIDNWKKL